VKDTNGDLLADSHKILNRRKNHLSFPVVNLHDINGVRETNRDEPITLRSRDFEVEIVTQKLKRLTKFAQIYSIRT
jgi:hypothetical protein